MMRTCGATTCSETSRSASRGSAGLQVLPGAGLPSRSLISVQLKRRPSTQLRRAAGVVRPVAIGPGPTEDKSGKSLRREEEPEEYWKSAAEKRGDSPWKDPLAIIGIISILLPFVILAIAIATGLVDVSAGR